MSNDSTPSGGMAWIQARILLRHFKRVARLEAWPDTFTPEELAALQYPWEGAAQEKRKAAARQRGFIGLLRKAMDIGAVQTTAITVDVPIMERKTVVTSAASPDWRATSWGDYSPRHTLVSQSVQVGTEPREVETLTASSFSGWAKGNYVVSSEHVAAWIAVGNRHKPTEETKQFRREGVLREWLAGGGRQYLEHDKLTLTRLQAWGRLEKLSDDFEPEASEGTIEKFFKKQRLVRFKQGNRG